MTSPLLQLLFCYDLRHYYSFRSGMTFAFTTAFLLLWPSPLLQLSFWYDLRLYYSFRSGMTFAFTTAIVLVWPWPLLQLSFCCDLHLYYCFRSGMTVAFTTAFLLLWPSSLLQLSFFYDLRLRAVTLSPIRWSRCSLLSVRYRAIQTILVSITLWAMVHRGIGRFRNWCIESINHLQSEMFVPRVPWTVDGTVASGRVCWCS